MRTIKTEKKRIANDKTDSWDTTTTIRLCAERIGRVEKRYRSGQEETDRIDKVSKRQIFKRCESEGFNEQTFQKRKKKQCKTHNYFKNKNTTTRTKRKSKQ